MGRPPSDNPRTVQIQFRVTEAEKAKIDRERGSRSISDHVRDRVLK